MVKKGVWSQLIVVNIRGTHRPYIVGRVAGGRPVNWCGFIDQHLLVKSVVLDCCDLACLITSTISLIRFIETIWVDSSATTAVEVLLIELLDICLRWEQSRLLPCILI